MGFWLYFAGFASGWVVRSTVDSSRGLTVRAIAFAHHVAEGTKRWVAIERESLEDLLAEGRAQYEWSRGQNGEATARSAASAGAGVDAKEYVQ